MNMVKVLEAVGCEVNYNPNQTCCGQPAYNAGYQPESCAGGRQISGRLSAAGGAERATS